MHSVHLYITKFSINVIPSLPINSGPISTILTRRTTNTVNWGMEKMALQPSREARETILFSLGRERTRYQPLHKFILQSYPHGGALRDTSAHACRIWKSNTFACQQDSSNDFTNGPKGKPASHGRTKRKNERREKKRNIWRNWADRKFSSAHP